MKQTQVLRTKSPFNCPNKIKVNVNKIQVHHTGRWHSVQHNKCI